MESTSVIQKGLPKDYFLHIKGDSLVSQKWGETPSNPTTLFPTLIGFSGEGISFGFCLYINSPFMNRYPTLPHNTILYILVWSFCVEPSPPSL